MQALLATAPALPLGEGGKYVAGAYIVFVILLVVYVAIMAAKVSRIERELRELAGFAEAKAEAEKAAPGGGSEEPPGNEEPSISGSLAPHGSGGGGA